MIEIIALIVSFIPPVSLYFWLRGLKKEDAAYKKNCRKLLLGGVLCTGLVVLFSLTMTILWNVAGFDRFGALAKAAFSDFILAALSEELMKFHIAKKTIRNGINEVSYSDCVAFVAIVGIGFGLADAIVYFFTTNWIQILVRGLTFMHASFGMLMGHFIAKNLKTGKRSYMAAAIILPWLLHGMYDFSLAEEFIALNDNLVFVPFIMIIITFIVGFRSILKIRRAKKNDALYEALM